MIIATKKVVIHRARRGWPYNGNLNIPCEDEKETAYSTAWDAVEIMAESIFTDSSRSIAHTTSATKNARRQLEKRLHLTGRKPKPATVDPKKYDEAYQRRLNRFAERYKEKELGK